MKYNFVAKLAIGEMDSKILSSFVGGLEVVTTYKIQVRCDANTELPENYIAELKAKIDQYFTDKLGEEIDVELVSIDTH